MEWISNLQVNLPAGKDGDRYNVPWRRKLMIFWEAFHLSLRLQKTKLLFPTIKEPGWWTKYLQNMQKQFDSTLKIFPLFCYLEFDESYNEGDQREEGPFFCYCWSYYNGVVVVFVFVQISDTLSVPWQLVACLFLDSIFILYFLSLLVCLYNSYLFVVVWFDSSFFVIVCDDRCCWGCPDCVSRICFVWVTVAQLAVFLPKNFRFNGTALYYQMSPASLSIKSTKL